MNRKPLSRNQARRQKSLRKSSPALESLEDRLAPGDTVLAGALASLFLPAPGGAFPAGLPAVGGVEQSGAVAAPRSADPALPPAQRGLASRDDTVAPLREQPTARGAALPLAFPALDPWSESSAFAPAQQGARRALELTALAGLSFGSVSGAAAPDTAAPLVPMESPAVQPAAAPRRDERAVLDAAASVQAPAVTDGGCITVGPGCTGFAFDDFSSSDGLALNGDAAQAGDRLRLTRAVGNLAGSAWFESPQFVEGGFDTTFQFQFSLRSNPNADGITFAIQNSESGTTALGGIGGGLGYGANESGLGIANSLVVEFDTFRNNALSDGTANQISVHTAGTLPNNAHEAYSLGRIGGLPELDNTQVHTARVRYEPGVLDVFLDDLDTPRLTVTVDLAATLNLADGRAWVGFTSSTGSSWERHDILSWSFTVCATCTELAYGDFSSSAGLRFNGAAAVVDSRLRLTADVRGQAGSAWTTARPVVADGFWTLFQFQLTPNGTDGDGLAFVIQNAEPTSLGQAGDGLGYAGVPNSLAVEFDTFGNAETRDPNGNHLSVQTRGTLPNSAHHDFSLGAATTIPELADGGIHTVFLLYVPGVMLVFLDDFAAPQLVLPVDLAGLLNLTTGRAWVGFTAATGLATENHDVLDWWFGNCLQ